MTGNKHKMTKAETKPFKYFQSESEFDDLCLRWQDREFIALDTEFVRTNTFYSRLGLIQLADSNSCVLQDPLVVNDWSGFADLLAAPNRSILLHSCSEDLNVLHTGVNCLPGNILDTQIAAAFLGIGFALSYQALVKVLLDLDIPKDETRSNWLQRPLTDKQLAYAANDVIHLETMWQVMAQQLADKGALDWFYEECRSQLAIASEFEDPKKWESLYSSISNSWRLNDRGLDILQALCVWREGSAREFDKPRSWIAKDNELLAMALYLANSDSFTIQELRSVEDISRKFIDRYGPSLLDFLDSQLGKFQSIDRELLNKPLSPSLRKVLKLFQRKANDRAEGLLIAPELLARKRQLLSLLQHYERTGTLDWSASFSTWQQELLESDFQQVITA